MKKLHQHTDDGLRISRNVETNYKSCINTLTVKAAQTAKAASTRCRFLSHKPKQTAKLHQHTDDGLRQNLD